MLGFGGGQAKGPLFEKNGAKTFLNLGRSRRRQNAPDPDSKKFFAAFLQKSSTFSLK
jgi:hypothetical protein